MLIKISNVKSELFDIYYLSQSIHVIITGLAKSWDMLPWEDEFEWYANTQILSEQENKQQNGKTNSHAH